MPLQKGICYQPFPAPYNPSMANHTWLYFGSDIASDPFAPLFGWKYKSSKGSSCDSAGSPHCRGDIDTLKAMGCEAIRLYDWEPRNKHGLFLDGCHGRGLSVLAPVSNYFLNPGEGFPMREDLIPKLIKSYANEAGTDYHAAIAGVIFGNELAGYGAEQCVTFTQDWVRIQKAQFPSFRDVKIGHPVQFDKFGGRFPCFNFWDKLMPPLKADPAIAPRLFLAPQTYNPAAYLFEDAESSGSGWVDQAWKAYELPIWFTEIGKNRMDNDHVAVVAGQLKGVLKYSAEHPDRLIGACFFQFADKVWVPGTTEGSFGAFSHGSETLCSIQYGPEDFTHWDIKESELKASDNTLNVDVLVKSDLYEVVKSAYNPG